jgi:hypothetical protein
MAIGHNYLKREMESILGNVALIKTKYDSYSKGHYRKPINPIIVGGSFHYE